MSISCNTTVYALFFLVWTLTSAGNCVVNGELSYGIGFYHGDTSIPDSTSSKSSNVDDEDERSLSAKRQLQQWCFAQCSAAPARWLIILGCSTECRLKGKLSTSNEEMMEQDYITNDDGQMMEQDPNDELRRDLQTILSTYDSQMGKPEILPGLGDTSASQFYATVRVVLPSTNPCKSILLNMTDKMYPSVINL